MRRDSIHALAADRSFSLFASLEEGVAYYTKSKEPTVTHTSQPSLVL